VTFRIERLVVMNSGAMGRTALANSAVLPIAPAKIIVDEKRGFTHTVSCLSCCAKQYMWPLQPY